MTDLLDGLKPADEERYLASLLTSVTTRNLRDEALRMVEPDDFSTAPYRSLWLGARHVADMGGRIDRRHLVAAALEADPLPPVRGRDGRGGYEQTLARVLDELAEAMPRPADFPAAVAEVKRCGQIRRLMEATQRIQQRALDADDPSQALAWAHEELAQLDNGNPSSHSHGFGDLLTRFDTAMRTTEHYRIIPTPWDAVNERIAGGLHPGRMYIIAARPGEGKSIAGHQLAEHAASLGYPAAIFSMEMGDLEVAGRIVANGAQIELDEISRRSLSERSWQQFQEYRARAENFPLTVNDRPDLSLSYVAAESRAYKRRAGLDVNVIDYLQMLKAERNVSREQQVAHISRTLKQLSRELKTAVVVPTQLNRRPTERGKPLLSDLRESGGIEADADVVMLFSRQADDSGNPTGMLSINIAKNRHGRICEFELPWRPHYARIG